MRFRWSRGNGRKSYKKKRRFGRKGRSTTGRTTKWRKRRFAKSGRTKSRFTKKGRRSSSLAARVLDQVFPHIRTTSNASGSFKVTTLDDQSLFITDLGYSPADINQMFFSNTGGANTGKLTVHSHRFDIWYKNMLNQSTTITPYILICKDDLPLVVGQTTIAALIANTAADDATASGYAADPYGNPMWLPWSSTGLRQFFHIKRLKSRKLLPGATYHYVTKGNKPFTFANPKYVAQHGNYIAYRGQRLIMIANQGSLTLEIGDATHTHTSFGEVQVATYTSEYYDYAYQDLGNNQVGYTRAGPVVAAAANAATWERSLLVGAANIAIGPIGIN